MDDPINRISKTEILILENRIERSRQLVIVKISILKYLPNLNRSFSRTHFCKVAQ